MDERKRRKKKPNKEQRERLRAEKANIYEEGFKHGYSMGMHEGLKRAEANK